MKVLTDYPYHELRFVSVFLQHRFGIALEAFDRIVDKTRDITRPGRSVVRNKKPEKLFSMNYKML